MKLKIYSYGKRWHQELLAYEKELLKRIAPHLKIELVTQGDFKAPLPKTTDTTNILLTPGGRSYSSESFAARINTIMTSGKNLSFFIGPADGFPSAVLTSGVEALSFGAHTMSHQLARVILVEQL